LKTKFLQQQRKNIISDSQTLNNEEDDKDEEHDSSGSLSAPLVDDEAHKLMSTESDYPKKFQKSKKVSNKPFISTTF